MDPLARYSINNFFQRFSPISQEDCDRLAATIGGGAIATPTSTQGSQSYTVRVGNGASSFIVQFRDPNYTIDFGLQAVAQETYGQFVPICQKRGESLGPLQVYTMNYVSGEALLRLNSHLHQPGNFHLLRQTVLDFAAQPASMPRFSKATIQADYSSRLERIAKDLPNTFQPLLSKLRSEVPPLFAHDHPVVINHWDLLENNIHVDAQIGHITGIVDWRDAEAGPFAMQFWGLENILGIRRNFFMDFHPRHVELHRLFWQRLSQEIGSVSEATMNAILTARMVGIFFASGDLVYYSDDDRVRSLAVLESLVLKLDDIGLGDQRK